MRFLLRSFTVLLVMVAFDSTQTLAKGPGSGNSGSGMQSNDHQNNGNNGSNASNGTGFFSGKGMNSGQSMGQGMNSNKVFDANNKPEFSGSKGEGRDSWRYRWNNGRWWFWGPGDQWYWYGDDGRWLYYNNAYVVNRPVLENFSGDPIKIVNPAKNAVTLNYTLDGILFNIQPGYSQDLREDRAWVIQFSRGENLDQARYGLHPGVYTFGRSDHGWELYRSELPQAVAPPAPITAPTNPSIAPANPTAAAPTNPPGAAPTNAAARGIRSSDSSSKLLPVGCHGPARVGVKIAIVPPATISGKRQ